MPERTDERTGVLAGLAAYGLWGLFPLVFRELADVDPVEIVLHRVVWSFVVVLGLLAVRRRMSELEIVARDRRRLLQLTAAAAFVSVNWLTYIWAVNHGHVVEAALGYYINPLLTVALGVGLLREHLRPTQRMALGLGAAAVAVLTLSYGRPPWIALILASSFCAYGYVKNGIGVPAGVSLAVETAVMVPVALVGMAVLGSRGELAFTHGSLGRDALLVGLGFVTAVPLLLFAAAASRIPLSMLGLLQYLTPTLQFLCGVVVLGEDLPTARLVGFVLVWLALVALASDALRAMRAGRRAGPHRRTDPEPAELV